MGDRLATIDMDRKLGAVPFGEGELSPHLTKCRLGRGLPPYQVTSWSTQPFSQKMHEPKIGGGCAPLGRGAGSPSNTMWPGPRPTSMPSFTLILHPAVWSQYTVGHKEPTYFCLWLRQKSTDFNVVFTVRFWNERYMWRYVLHPPYLINVATLPCESRKTENAREHNFSFLPRELCSSPVLGVVILSVRPPVRPSVRPSVTRVLCD